MCIVSVYPIIFYFCLSLLFHVKPSGIIISVPLPVVIFLINISYPFRLKDDPRSCGKREYELACKNNRTILYQYSGKYRVEEINYEIFTERVVADFSSPPLDPSTLHRYGILQKKQFFLLFFIFKSNIFTCCSWNHAAFIFREHLQDRLGAQRLNGSTRGQKIDNSSCSAIHDWLSIRD